MVFWLSHASPPSANSARTIDAKHCSSEHLSGLSRQWQCIKSMKLQVHIVWNEATSTVNKSVYQDGGPGNTLSRTILAERRKREGCSWNCVSGLSSCTTVWGLRCWGFATWRGTGGGDAIGLYESCGRAHIDSDELNLALQPIALRNFFCSVASILFSLRIASLKCWYALSCWLETVYILFWRGKKYAKHKAVL